jgi:hypothetical protein
MEGLNMANKPSATLLAHWRHHMDSNIPAPPHPDEAATVHHIMSFNAVATADGIRIRWVTDEGQLIDMMLNAVVAHAVMIMINRSGDEEGWLDELGALMGRHRPI